MYTCTLFVPDGGGSLGVPGGDAAHDVARVLYEQGSVHHHYQLHHAHEETHPRGAGAVQDAQHPTAGNTRPPIYI